ncbi:hypothetical protein [Trichocoleus sp. FACHB-262]|uniref:DUF7219 family protein n=1 Tax=Trichocoleus sp. FACHB-262 TaxID=2692869 RepID=UPI001682CA7A|nr:hypothetical protein [Trichocoleus sp. FACHB-262]MBD2121706.1 hypothetical protein [Trichocoleus sp. FACHB-262]
MANCNNAAKDNFFYPRSHYYGAFTPETLAFNANLQEFSQKVAYISALETGGKLPPEQAYKQVKTLWKQLKRSRKALGISPNLYPDNQ